MNAAMAQRRAMAKAMPRTPTMIGRTGAPPASVPISETVVSVLVLCSARSSMKLLSASPSPRPPPPASTCTTKRASSTDARARRRNPLSSARRKTTTGW
jgi:hypothetical protein